MAKPNLILSTSTGYQWDHLRDWTHSAVRTGHEVASLFINGDPVTMDACRAAGATVHDYAFQQPKQPPATLRKRLRYLAGGSPVRKVLQVKAHNLRYLFQYRFLKAVAADYQNVVISDCRDVMFLSDPFPTIEKIRSRTGAQVLCGSECLRYRDDVNWGDANLKEIYPFVYDDFRNNEIANVGVLCGDPERLAELCLLIYCSAIARPNAISDQATFNVLLGTTLIKETVRLCPLSDDLVVHLGTVGPTELADLFRDRLTEPAPRFRNGVPMTTSGDVFPIVHQYDRIVGARDALMSRLEASGSREAHREPVAV